MISTREEIIKDREGAEIGLYMIEEEWYLEDSGINSMDGNFLLIHQWEEEDVFNDLQCQMIEDAHDILSTDPRTS